MLDDDIKGVKNLESDLRKSLKGRIIKHKDQDKLLYTFQTTYIEIHRKGCVICQASYESYLANMNIPMTPPCNTFMENMKSHIESCDICNNANKKWNEDAIPVTDSMRKGVCSIRQVKEVSKQMIELVKAFAEIG